MKDTNKETAVQNEQQLKLKQEIIDDIIKILADNNLTIVDSKNILYETFKSICQQKVMFSNISYGWIDTNSYCNSSNN